MADEYAGPATIVYLGRPLVEIESCRITRTSNARKVKTMALGLAGRTKGAPEWSMTFASAVPITGYENDWNTQIVSQDLVTIGVRSAGVEETVEGWIETTDSNFEVDTPTKQDMTFMGRLISTHPY